MASAVTCIGSLTANGQYLPNPTLTATTVVPIDCTDQGFGDFSIQITGTWTGTISFYEDISGLVLGAGNANNGAGQPLYMYVNGLPTTWVTSTTSNGIFKPYNASGLTIYVAATASMTGTATVYVRTNSIL